MKKRLLSLAVSLVVTAVTAVSAFAYADDEPYANTYLV